MDAEPACLPTASISRVVLAAQPGRIATRAFGARRSLSVPSTLVSLSFLLCSRATGLAQVMGAEVLGRVPCTSSDESGYSLFYQRLEDSASACLQLVFCLTAAAAIWTALQQRLQAVRSCKACKGYGIQR